MSQPLIERIVEVLDKVQFDEAISLSREIKSTAALNPHVEPILALKVLVLKNAHKNSAEAVKALEHLGLVEEAMELHAVLNRELVTTSQELNKA